MSVSRYYTTSKDLGETPLEALERLREDEKIDSAVPLAYAGRLDPMATGALLILAGDECKVQEKYHNLDKEYYFEVLVGATSDSGDVLGIIESASEPDTATDVESVARSIIGMITLPYPHFSSKTVKGKPLHMWTLEGKLSEIEIPTKTSTVYRLDYHGKHVLRADELIGLTKEMIDSIPKVIDPRKAMGADFRRHDVRNSWQRLYSTNPMANYTIHRFRCIASSGTYMRSLAELIGKKLGSGAFALSIHRTRIGKYVGIPGVGGFWIKTYARAN